MVGEHLRDQLDASSAIATLPGKASQRWGHNGPDASCDAGGEAAIAIVVGVGGDVLGDGAFDAP